MVRFFPRIACILLLTMAASACGAASTPSAAASDTPTVTQFVLPPEVTSGDAAGYPSDSGGNTVLPADFTAAPAEETSVIATEALPVDTPDPANVTPTLAGLTNLPTHGSDSSGPRCNNALFIDDVTIPDGSVMKPGESFVKTWRFENYGTCRWNANYAIGFGYGTRLSGVDVKIPNAVDPGGKVDVSVTLIAPENNGWYGGWWRLRTDAGVYFGDFVYVSIQVLEGTPSTPTPGS